MLYVLLASACIPLVVLFADKIIKHPDGLVTLIPGMFGDGIRLPKECFNGFSFIAIIFIGLWFYKARPFRNIWVALCLLWTFFISLISRYEFSFYFLFYELLGFLVIATLSSIEIKDFDKIVRRFLKVIAIAGLIQCVFALLQILCLDQFFTVKSNNFTFKLGDGIFTHRIVAFIGNPSILGIFLAMILPIYLYLKERWASLAFILVLAIIYLTNSQTAWLSSIISVFFYYFFANKRIFAYLTIIAVMSCIMFGGQVYNNRDKIKDLVNDTGRVKIWKKGFKYWQNADKQLSLGAITGHGLRSWEYEIGQSDKDVQEQWHEAHNDFIQVAYETGVIGFVLYMMFLFSVFKFYLKNLTKETIVMMSCLISFLCSGLTQFPLYSSCMIGYVVIFVGLILNKGEVNA